MVSILHFCYRYLTVYETFPPPYTRNILFGMNTWWMNALFSFGKNKSGVQILSNLLESNSKMSSFPDVQVVKRASTQLKWSMMLTVKSCKEIELGIFWSMNVGCRYMYIHVKKEEYWIPYVLARYFKTHVFQYIVDLHYYNCLSSQSLRWFLDPPNISS